METLAIIGFGEAGKSIGKALAGVGRADVRAYDVRMSGIEKEALFEFADGGNVRPFCDMSEALEGASIVISTVVAGAAAEVAATAGCYLTSGQLFVDLNSVSPERKREMALIIGDSGAKFVEGAIMGRVVDDGHRAPILLSGPHALEGSDRLNAIGMNTSVAGWEVGQASAVKMLRSVMVKGVSALLVECLAASRCYGVTEAVFSSVDETFPGMNWSDMAVYYLRRSCIHGNRMASEMEEVAATLRAVGIDPIITKAVGRRMTVMGQHGREAFNCDLTLVADGELVASLARLKSEGVVGS